MTEHALIQERKVSEDLIEAANNFGNAALLQEAIVATQQKWDLLYRVWVFSGALAPDLLIETKAMFDNLAA